MLLKLQAGLTVICFITFVVKYLSDSHPHTVTVEKVREEMIPF